MVVGGQPDQLKGIIICLSVYVYVCVCVCVCVCVGNMSHIHRSGKEASILFSIEISCNDKKCGLSGIHYTIVYHFLSL